MAEARSEQAWMHTSSLLALLANLHRDAKKTRTYKPSDFNPHLRRKTQTPEKVEINLLKQIFVRPQGGP
jgi:hypothetical protein